MNKIVGVILAGGQGERLSILAAERAKPAVIFGGSYRIIDFTLSNCVNSGIYSVAILTQYRPRSLNDHIGIGRPWDLDRRDGGVYMLQPYTARGETDWYSGTADAVYQNLYFIEESRADYVMVLSGDHIYQMRYDNMLDFHRATGADITVGVVEVPISEASRYGLVDTDEHDEVISFLEKPENPPTNLASMGIYVFSTKVLIDRLELDARDPNSSHDFGKDILPSMIGDKKVMAYRFHGYWRDVGTIEAYWQSNMDLLVDLPEINLYDPDNIIHTKISEKPSAKIGPRAHISRSIISNGCIINGYVEHSVLSPGVYVEEGAVIRDSIVFHSSYIEADAVVNRSILDKEVRVSRGCQIGFGDDFSPNKESPNILSTGITVVGKRTVLPSGVRIGRNCILGAGLTERDFENHFIASGSTVELPALKGRLLKLQVLNNR